MTCTFCRDPKAEAEFENINAREALCGKCFAAVIRGKLQTASEITVTYRAWSATSLTDIFHRIPK